MDLQITNYTDKHEFVSDNGVRSIVYLMDCMEGLKQIPDKYFELAIVDPPYGSNNIQGGYTSGKGGGITKQNKYNSALWLQKEPNTDYFTLLKSISVNQIIWGANHFISKMPFDSSCWIVWDKLNGENSFADCELAWTSFKTAVRMFDFRWQGMLQGNMKNKEDRIHPTQKPIALYEWIIRRYYIGGGILDTHLGSGSSRIACHKANIPFMGFELDADYFYASVKRFEEVAKQKVIF